MSNLLKVSASTLEDYRICRIGKYGKTLQDFLRKLDEPWIKTEAQSKGDAYHKILEHGGNPYRETGPDKRIWYRVNEPGMNIDWIFTERQAAPALKTFADYPDKKHEVWGRLNFDIGGYSIKMSLRKDAVTDTEIWDYKTTSSKWPPARDNYEDSVQWPLYMMESPQMPAFHYRVFHFSGETVNQHDFVFLKDDKKERAAILWLTDLIAFSEEKKIIEKFKIPQPT